jgi:hypothetical protein
MKKILFALGILSASVVHSDQHTDENFNIIDGEIGSAFDGRYYSDNLRYKDDPIMGGIAPSGILQSINIKPLAYILATSKILWSERTDFKRDNVRRHEYHLITENFGRDVMEGVSSINAAYAICYVDFRILPSRYPNVDHLKNENIASLGTLADIGPAHSLKRWKCEVWNGSKESISQFGMER